MKLTLNDDPNVELENEDASIVIVAWLIENKATADALYCLPLFAELAEHVIVVGRLFELGITTW